MEHLLTIENLQDVGLNEYIPTEVPGYYRHKDGPYNAWRKFKQPNIEAMRKLVQANQVIEPLLWLLKIQDKVNVRYEKYLELIEYKAIKNGNKNMLKTVQEYKEQYK